MIFHYDPNAPQPRPFAFRLRNRSMCFTIEELAILNSVAHQFLALAVSKMQSELEGLDLTSEQRREVYQNFATQFTEDFLPQVFKPFAQMAGAA